MRKMKNTLVIVGLVLAATFAVSMAACTGGGKSLNSAEALKAYLDKQPANSPDKPIRVSMGANAPMMEKIAEAISSSGKYVSLNLSGSALTTIPVDTFKNCKTLVGVTIPNSVTTMDGAFRNCASLTSVTIGNGVTSIGVSTFEGCTGLTSVTIPNSVTSIGWMAFSGTGLTSVTIPNSVTTMDGAFRSCASLTSVTIGNGVTSIGVSTFEGCTGLTSVTIPDSVTSIGVSAFKGCTGLTSVTIPDSVNNIGEGAFIGCTNLTSFKWIRIGSNSPLNGTWTGFINWQLKFTNEYYEFSRIGQTPHDKGFYFISGGDVNFIPILGDVKSKQNFSINGNTLTWGSAVYTRQ